MSRITTAIALMLFLLVATADARMESDSREVDAEGAQQIETSIDFAAGEIYIMPKDMDQAAILNIEYNPRRVDYEVSYRLKGKTGLLDLESVHRRNRDVDSEDNSWELLLSTRYPQTLELDVGACDADFELGGIPITDVNLDVGAASGTIRFSEVNPEKLEFFSIDAGAASVEIKDIGNSRFEVMDFDGGAGAFELDFRGDAYEGDAEVTIDVGMGSCDIIIPRGLGVEVETDGDGWLSSIDFHGTGWKEVDDDLWQTKSYEGAEATVTFNISVGMGSVDFYIK